jgi:hypothetical protein
VTNKNAPAEKTLGGARTVFTDEQIAHIKSKILELIPQGWTIRQVLAEPDMCRMTFLYRDLLPNDEDFIKQCARAFELRNDYWAEEIVEIADDGTNDWVGKRCSNAAESSLSSSRGIGMDRPLQPVLPFRARGKHRR